MTLKTTFYLALLFQLLFVACSEDENESEGKKYTNASADSLHANVPSYNDEHFEEDETTYEEPDESELNFIVSVADGYNYDSLKSVALKSAKLLKFKFDTLGRYYNPAKKSIVLPNDADDEMYAGEYLFRRNNDDFVSLEMKYLYPDTSLVKNQEEFDSFNNDTTRMFVFAAMYPNKSSADSLLRIIKKDFPNSKLIPAKVYMGCMH